MDVYSPNLSSFIFRGDHFNFNLWFAYIKELY